MKRQFLLLAVAALLGALGAQAVQAWLRPTPAYAGTALSRMTARDDGSVVVTAKEATLVLAPDGSVRVTAPGQVTIGGPNEDVKIEGHRVTIDASSELKVETSDMNIDARDYKLESRNVAIGEYGAEIKLADGGDPICINRDGQVVKSQYVKSR